MMFFELKFEDQNVIKELGIIKKSETGSNYVYDLTHEIDINRLSKFITFDIKFRKSKSNSTTHFIRAKHRHCTKEDFINNGYNINLLTEYKNLICF